MKKNTNVCLLMLISTLNLFALPVVALDIPLDGGTSSGGGGMRLGYVDMERIFQVYPQTKFAKEDYAKQLKVKREALAKKEKELTDIKNRLSVLESTLRDRDLTDVAVSSDAAAPSQALPSPDTLLDLQKQLEEKEAEYEEDRKRATDELTSFESKQSQVILGKIYEALRDLANEEQVAVVVDKTSILFGSAEIDLTEKLQAKVRGY